MKVFIYLIILLLLVAPVSSKYISLPYKQTLDTSKLLSIVNVNFDIKDSNGNPLQNALIIIQGISDISFNRNLITNSDGMASTTLNMNEIFVYTIYKISYTPFTGNIFTNSNKDLAISLEDVPSDRWYFYYLNNGEVELTFKSLDSDTNYLPGEYINEVLEVKNIAGRNLELVEEETSLLTVDSLTLNRLRWWGSLTSEDLLQDVLVEITLKKDGWLKTTVNDGNFEICVGNAIGKYKGQSFDVSGSEFICKTDQSKNLIPEWILENKYKVMFDVTYLIDGQKKFFQLLTQDFLIENPLGWKPDMELISGGIPHFVGKEIVYNIPLKYPANFVYYSLLEAPEGMKIDGVNGVITWTPEKTGRHKVVVRASYPYFEDGSLSSYTDGELNILVFGDYCPSNNPSKSPESINGSQKQIKIYCR